jgi:cell filamentation protein
VVTAIEPDRGHRLECAKETLRHQFLAYLNAIHPFREGNGRSQLAFLHLVAIRAGHPIEIARIKPTPFLDAMILSFSGDTDPLVHQLRTLFV